MSKSKDLAQLKLDLATDSALESFDKMAEALRSAADEVERYKQRFQQTVKEQPKDAAQTISWAVNSIGCLNSNMRLDLMVSRAAEVQAAVIAFQNATDD